MESTMAATAGNRIKLTQVETMLSDLIAERAAAIPGVQV